MSRVLARRVLEHLGLLNAPPGQPPFPPAPPAPPPSPPPFDKTGLVGLWNLPDSQVGTTSLIGTPGPTLSFAGSLGSSSWQTDVVGGRTVNVLNFAGSHRATGSGSGMPSGASHRSLVHRAS